MGLHKDKMKSLLIISQLDMQKAGNQLLFQTVRGYVAAGYRVIFLTSNPASDPNRADYDELLGQFMAKVSIYRFTPLFRPLAKVVFQARRFLLRHHSICQQTLITDVTNAVPFGTSGGKSILGLLSWISFILVGSFKAVSLARRHKVKVVYGYEIYGAPVAWIVARLFKIPLITKFQGTIASPELERGGAWLRIPHHLLALKIPADLIIMENDGTRGKEVLRKLGMPEQRIRFWIDGVRKDMYIPQFDRRLLLDKLGLSYDTKIVLVVSKLKKWKRVDRAIRAMSQVIQKIPNAFLVIVGDGPERENLENLARILGVGTHVMFIGPVPHDEVRYFFNGCDLFLSLYDHSNLCNPVLEALTCGKCIITINDGSTKDLLVNGYNAILINKSALERELPETIISLLLNKEKRDRIARNARNYAQRYLCSWEERMAMEIDEVEKLFIRKRK